MADAPNAAPAAAPAPTEAPKPHHSALQPRAPQGTFAGAPDPSRAPAPAAGTEAPAPKAWKWGDKEITDPDELYREAQHARTLALEKAAEKDAAAKYYREAQENARKARELEDKLKDPRKLLTPEQRYALLEEEAKAWAEEERIKALPPAEQRLELARRELLRQKAEIDAARAEHDRLAKEAKDAEDRKRQEAEDAAARDEMMALIHTTLESAGLPRTTENMQHVAGILRGNLVRGVTYSPEVMAAKVRAKVAESRAKTLESVTVEDLVSESNLKKLAAIEDPAVLRKLAGVLGDKLRRLNLSDLGLRPEPVPTPVAGGVATGEPDWPAGDPRWDKYLRDRLRNR